MQAIEYQDPIKECACVKLMDPVDVSGKHYAVAVDIYDDRTTDILLSFFNVLNRKDKVTLITFGNHTQQQLFDMADGPNMFYVKNMLSRQETGLNTLVGFHKLEQTRADAHIMITAGYNDSAPEIEFGWRHYHSERLKVFYPGSELAERYTSFTFSDKFYFPKHGPHERTIRKALSIQPPQYMNIMMECCGDRILIPPIPYGGCRVHELNDVQNEYAINTTLYYTKSDGTQEEVRVNQQGYL